MRKILVVEDSALHQKMYDVMLALYRNNGAEILHASNGMEGLALLIDNPDTDLVILDINMPVMSGLEFLRRMKEEEAFRNLPVIICSTEGKDEDILRGLQKGAQGYIKKPFKAEDLIAMVERIVGKKSFAWKAGMECQRP